MARKLRGFERVLDAPALFAVAYGEIASSLYIALGIVAAQALGLTPLVLLLTGALFFMVSLSYAEGTAAIPETGGAATFVRRAFNDLAGFITGWVLFLDFLIVMALSALFAPHYLGAAISAPSVRDSPWDAAIGCALIAAIAGIRLARRTRVHLGSLAIAILDLVVQGLLVVLGAAFLLSPDVLVEGLGFASGQDWTDLAYALPLAMLAYTGLETVANLAEETREPGRTLPRSLFSAIGLVVVLTVLIAVVGLSAFPVENGQTALADEWLRAPLAGIVDALQGSLPGWLGDALRVYVGLTGALVLLAAATTSISGFTRLAYSFGEHRQLPRSFGRLNRRTLVSPQAIVAAAGISIALVIVSDALADDVIFLASLYSFGVLLAFAAAQLAVLRLRVTEPDLERPFRAPLAAPLIGAPLVIGVWILAVVTHPGARYAGPAWLLLGVVVYVLVRRRERSGLFHETNVIDQLPPGAEFDRLLVPMKLGPIGEEMVATAVALAKERDARVDALFVIVVPLEFPIDAPLWDLEEQAAASLAEAVLLGEENDVRVEPITVRARAIGQAILEQAGERESDLIVLGSSPRWRRQSAFFSPTVDYVLRSAPCEVLVVAFPQGVLEDVG
jgi:APA family basic amino acid/polyamine antiporter